MTVVESFAAYLQALGIGTLGQDLWIGEAPSSMNSVDTLCWIVASGGSPLVTNQTGEMTKEYQVQIFYRDRDYKDVSTVLFGLEEELNCDGCTQLSGFDTVDMKATQFPIDNDLDSEDRKVGLLSVTITTYKEC